MEGCGPRRRECRKSMYSLGGPGLWRNARPELVTGRSWPGRQRVTEHREASARTTKAVRPRATGDADGSNGQRALGNGVWASHIPANTRLLAGLERVCCPCRPASPPAGRRGMPLRGHSSGEQARSSLPKPLACRPHASTPATDSALKRPPGAAEDRDNVRRPCVSAARAVL